MGTVADDTANWSSKAAPTRGHPSLQIDHLHDARIAGDHAVGELLARRLTKGSEPGRRDDNATLALVIEGGCMRGVISAGMVTALGALGLKRAFDLVVGTSAGAFSGAFFLAGKPGFGTRIYYEELLGREWLDYRRPLRGQPAVALDYLIDDVMVKRKPLDWDSVVASRVPLYAIATSLQDYKPLPLAVHDDRLQPRVALFASACIPVIAGAAVTIGGASYVDGSFSESIPVRSAARLGATHFVVLLTRPRGQTRHHPGSLERRIGGWAMNRMIPGLGDAYLQCPKRYERELALVENLSSVALAIQPPPQAKPVAQFEQDPEILRAGAQAGVDAVHHALVATDDTAK
jgi:predicted patatin/cPLA2 family phospholipase